MTYRDLIFYILQNHLEDKEILTDGKIAGFISIEEAAKKYDVGISTIEVWVGMNMLPSIKLANYVFIPEYAVNPIGRLKGDDETNNAIIRSHHVSDDYRVPSSNIEVGTRESTSINRKLQNG